MKNERTKSDERKTINITKFGAIIVCFLLPFVTVSCERVNPVTFTGLNLVFGTTIDGQSVPPDVLVVISFVCAIAGIFISMKINPARREKLSALAAMVGALILIAFKIDVDGRLTLMPGVQIREGGVSVHVEWGLGFYLVLLGFVGAGIANMVYLGKSNTGGAQIGSLMEAEGETSMDAAMSPKAGAGDPGSPAKARKEANGEFGDQGEGMEVQDVVKIEDGERKER